jgi:hypothetical protein
MGVIRDTWHMERVRVTTVRSTYLVVGCALVVGLLAALLIAALLPARPLTSGETVVALTAAASDLSLSVTGFFVAVLGVLAVSHDYRFGLGRTVLTAQPRRGVLMGVRLGVIGLVALGTAVGHLAVAAAATWLLGRTPAHDPGTVRALLFHPLVVVLWSWLGCGLAWLLRGSAGPIALLLAVPLVAEPVLTVAAGAQRLSALRPVVRWLPFGAARDAVSRQVMPTADSLGALAGAGVFAAFTGLVLLGGWWALARRDP